MNIGVLKKDSNSEWASPVFIMPKKNSATRFATNLHQANKWSCRKPYPAPAASDVMQKLEGFQCTTSLDSKMGCCCIRLDATSQKTCTLTLPWGKHQRLRLPMGLSGAPDVYQDKMSDLVSDLEYARAYLDDLLCLTSGSFTDHLNKLLVDYLNKNKSKKSDMLVRLWLEYAASSTIISAKFVLAK